jgi:DNA-binding response OmpR family regulator
MSLHVLLVDDNADDCAVTCLFLRASIARFRPLDVRVVRTWKAAKIRIVMDALDVLVLNHRVPDATAFQMLAALRGLPHPPVVVLTPQGELDRNVALLRAGAHECVMKHTNEWDMELRLAIERFAALAQWQRDLNDASGGLEDYAAILASVVTRQRAPWARNAFGSGVPNASKMRADLVAMARRSVSRDRQVARL